MCLVVEGLPSTCKALGSLSSTVKTKEKRICIVAALFVIGKYETFKSLTVGEQTKKLWYSHTME